MEDKQVVMRTGRHGWKITFPEPSHCRYDATTDRALVHFHWEDDDEFWLLTGPKNVDVVNLRHDFIYAHNSANPPDLLAPTDEIDDPLVATFMNLLQQRGFTHRKILPKWDDQR